MNSNELTRKVMGIVKNQIEPMVTEYMKEHPEYFRNCTTGAGMISSFSINLSYDKRRVFCFYYFSSQYNMPLKNVFITKKNKSPINGLLLN